MRLDLEFIADGEQSAALVEVDVLAFEAVEVHGSGGRQVEGIDRGRLVLVEVGGVYIKLAQTQAEAHRDAVDVGEVHIVGVAAVVVFGACREVVEIGVSLHRCSHVVVAGAQTQFGTEFDFGTHLDGAHGLEPTLGFAAQRFVFFRAPVVVPIVVASAIAHLSGGEVGIFIFGVDGKRAANGRGHGEVEAPGRVDFVFVASRVYRRRAALADDVAIVVKLCIGRVEMQVLVGMKVEEDGRMNSHAETERRVFDGTEDEAQFHVEAGARELFFLIHIIVLRCSAGRVDERFGIAQYTVHVDVVGTDGQAAVDLVVPVDRHIEVVLLYAAPLCAVVVVALRVGGLVVGDAALGVIDRGDELRVIAFEREGRGIVAVVVVGEVEPAVVDVGKVHHLPRLREAARGDVVEAEILLEVAAFVVVETEVDEFHVVVDGAGIDKANLVERGAGFAEAHEVYGVGLRVEATGHRHVAAAEQGDAGRVGAHGGDVCAERTHRAAHTDEAGRTVEVFAAERLHFINVLCHSGREGHQGCAQEE